MSKFECKTMLGPIHRIRGGGGTVEVLAGWKLSQHADGLLFAFNVNDKSSSALTGVVKTVYAQLGVGSLGPILSH